MCGCWLAGRVGCRAAQHVNHVCECSTDITSGCNQLGIVAVNLIKDVKAIGIRLNAECLNLKGLVGTRAIAISFDKPYFIQGLVDRVLRVAWIKDITVIVEGAVRLAIRQEDQLIQIGIGDGARCNCVADRDEIDIAVIVAVGHRKFDVVDELSGVGPGAGQRNQIGWTARVLGSALAAAICEEHREIKVDCTAATVVVIQVECGCRNIHAIKRTGIIVTSSTAVEISEGAEVETQ